MIIDQFIELTINFHVDIFICTLYNSSILDVMLLFRAAGKVHNYICRDSHVTSKLSGQRYSEELVKSLWCPLILICCKPEP